jgi:hypothetical protein
VSADGGQAVAVNVEPLAWQVIELDLDGSRVEVVQGEWWLLTRTLDADATVRAGGFSVEPMANEVCGQAVEVVEGLRAAACEALALAARLEAGGRVDDVAGIAGELSRLAGDNPALQARAAAAAWGLVGLSVEAVGR